jgi:hypothetical protein
MSRKQAFFFFSIVLLTGAAPGVALAGVPTDGTALAQPAAATTALADDPIVLAQVAPGTSEAEAVVVPAEAVEVSPGLLDRLMSFLAESYEREPALMIALGLVFVLSPIVSIALFAMQSTKRALAHRQTRRGQVLKQAMQAAGTTSATTMPGGAAFWNAEASLEFVDDAYDPLPLHGKLLRIGRHEENDVRLADKTVHRHHAVLQLTGDQGYTITDLSGAEGNGVLVNDERITQARLRHGDIVELGSVRLRFTINQSSAAAPPAGRTQVTLH